MHEFDRLIRPDDKEFGMVTFAHEDIGLKGVCGRPFVHLDKCLDSATFDEINYEIGIGLATNETGIQGGNVRGQIPPALRGEMMGDLESEIANNLDFYDPDGRHREAMRRMTRHQRQKYIYMVMGGLPVWHQLIYIRNIDPVRGTDKVTPYWTQEAEKLFPKTIRWAQTLPFERLGRVLIFATYPYYPIPTHRDWIQVPHRDHHINVTSHLNRGIFVYDEALQKKHYLDSQIRTYMFNLRDYHGVDAFKKYAYTLKVEGLFAPSFAQEIGLEEGGYVWR